MSMISSQIEEEDLRNEFNLLNDKRAQLLSKKNQIEENFNMLKSEYKALKDDIKKIDGAMYILSNLHKTLSEKQENKKELEKE